MRITTWNVNGLRAVLGKGLLDLIQPLNADVLCLQEIKSRPDQIETAHLQAIASVFPSLSWNPAQRPGYSGTATCARITPDEVLYGLGATQFDDEGRVIVHRYGDIHLYNIYFPNGGRDLARVPYKLDFYATLLEQCDQLHAQGQKVILCGDFNTSHREIDLRNPKSNQNQTGFLPEERAWIDRYLEHGFVDAFRALYPEKAEYTWWTFISNARARNVGWRLDYFLVSASLMDRVEDVINHNDVLGSDHCPVTLVLKT
jgi:exodeoxyribonuclease III